MNFEQFLKRYVWDDERTPYLVSVSKLHRRQADYEVRAFTIFVGTMFAVLSVAALSHQAPMGRSLGVSMYAFSVVCGCIIFAVTKAYLAALYLSAAPIATIGYLLTNGFPPNLAGVDKIFIAVFVTVWLAYSVRVAAIGRHYESMPEPPHPPQPGRRRR